MLETSEDIHLFSFSPAISNFLVKASALARKILELEARIAVAKKTFSLNGWSYPLRFVAFEHPSRLGYFDADFLEIGLNKCLMLYETSFLQEILRHEIAHYISYIVYGNQDKPHGEVFSKVCEQYGWNKEKKALLPIDAIAVKKKEEVMQKVEKLLNLSQSGNLHEATSALKLAQSLLLKHGLEYTDVGDEYHVKRVLKAPKTNQKLLTISEILRQFFVYPVISHSRNAVYLEVFGKETEISVAEYVAAFLNHELEVLWGIEKKKNPHLKGISAKNSFFQGIAKGFTRKSKEDENYQKALIVSDKLLEKTIPLAYPHLSKKRGRVLLDKNAHFLGQKAGALIKIKEALTSAKRSLTYLTFQNSS